MVVERGGDGLLNVDDIVVADAIQLLGGDPGLDVGLDHFQHLGGQAAGDAHLLDFFRGLDGHGHGGSLSGARRRALQYKEAE
ncbi:hypothetical protein D3C77_691530 [compost metagenome]